MDNAQLAVQEEHAAPNLNNYSDLPVLLFCLLSLVITISAMMMQFTILLFLVPCIFFGGVHFADQGAERFSDITDPRNCRPKAAAIAVPFISMFGIAISTVIYEVTVGQAVGLAFIGGLLATIAYQNGRAWMFQSTRLSAALRRFMHALVLMPHYGIDQMQGHRLSAATPSDPISSRMGEHYYRYLKRSIKGGVVRAFLAEQQGDKGKSTITKLLKTEVVQTLVLMLMLLGSIYYTTGLSLVGIFALQAVVACWQITSLEYSEHYGLLRNRAPNGEFEAFNASHSWKTSGMMSNRLLGGYVSSHRSEEPLERPVSSTPTPTYSLGSNVLTLCALLPRLWFAIADSKLAMAVDYDLKQVNLDGDAYVSLMERFHRAP